MPNTSMLLVRMLMLMLISMTMKMDICCLLYIGMIHDHENGKINYLHEKKSITDICNLCLGKMG